MKLITIIIFLCCAANLFGQCSVCNSIEDALKKPEKVEVLRLNNYALKEYPRKINFLRNLTELDLSNYEYDNENIINTISSKISTLNNLKILKLDNVNLKSIPIEIASLKNLESLYLGNNQNLSNIPNEIGELINIKELHLQNINLDSIPVWVTQLVNLEVLHLDGNRISHLPSTLTKLEKLRVLGLSNNKLGDKLTNPSFAIGDEITDTTNGNTGIIIEVNENSFLVEGWAENDPFEAAKFEIKKEFTNWVENPCPMELAVLYKMNWENLETIDIQNNNPIINNYLDGVSNSLEEYILFQKDDTLFNLQLFLPD